MSGNEVYVHPSASLHPGAKLDAGVWIGPGCVIGPHVTVDRNTRLESHVVIGGWTEIGSDCRFSPFAAVGGEPQDIGYKGEETRVKIGERNVFREFVTVHRATIKQDRLTRIGDDNYFMAYSHVAHDCGVGNRTIFLHGATLGGHVTVGDFATVGALSAVHQFCRLGRFSFIGGGSIITQDVLPFARVVGRRPPLVLGLNVIGLRRNGFTNARIAALKDMFKIFFFSNLNTQQALERLGADFPNGEDREEIIRFVQSSKRGLVKKSTESWDHE
ncbi:MAG: acyl-ACP--UDP-N-acetylglucosamine O-acyltransferase [Candidatus Aminicenantes bacterium]|nr:acyl-ACP--UDP-N-acetylglucosamine O-acyltransferase [Candidatus Aminicenantes bacterium]